jgi:predicted dehydrogenase
MPRRSRPNDTHYEARVAFLDKGIDVICDKLLTLELADALDLIDRQRRTCLVFGVTYAFAALAMVRQAREMVRAGELGRVRQVHIQFMQDWAVEPIASDHRGGQWRIDPARSGPSFTTADIGVHARHMACFVSCICMCAAPTSRSMTPRSCMCAMTMRGRERWSYRRRQERTA